VTDEEARRERLAAELRVRLQTDLGPYTRTWFERALEMVPNEKSVFFFELLEEQLARPPERVERELRNTHLNSGVSWSRPVKE
jgi:hypothetical protein